MRFKTGKIGTCSVLFSNQPGIRIKRVRIKRDPPAVVIFLDLYFDRPRTMTFWNQLRATK